MILLKNVDLPAQEEQSYKACGNRDVLLASSGQSRPKIRRIVSESDHAGCDFQGAAQNELPDEKKRHETAPTLVTVGLAKKMIATAGAWQRRPQFAPDQPVGKHDKRARQPAQHGLWTAHRSHQ